MARAKAVPKKKFAFSKRKKAAGAKKAAPEPAPEPEPVAEPEAEEFDSAYLVTQLSGETLCKTAGEIAAHDYAITDVSDCTIYLMDVIGALYIKRVKNCRIVCGPTRGSVHLDDVHDSSISLAARQVRVHKSTECKLHIFCASDPIIEHCSGIGIGSYALDYDGIAAHTKVSSRSTFVQRCRAVGHGPPASCTLTPASVLACSPRSWRPWQTAGAEFRTSTGCVRRSRRIGTLWTRVPMLQKRSCVPKISLLYAGHRS